MSASFFHYPSCDTCRKAAAWLKKRNFEFDMIDIVAAPPDAAALGAYWKLSGLPIQSFFNVAGESYRKGNFKERLPEMTDAQKLNALAADGKLIKRPLLVIKSKTGADAKVLVGFKEELWAATVDGLAE